MTTNHQKEREEAWVKIFNNLVLETDDYEGTPDEGNPTTLLKGSPESLKAFIESAIATEREKWVEKIEGMKKTPVHKYNCSHIEPCIEEENRRINDALDDIITELKS